MIRVHALSKHAIKMIKKRDDADHRKFHIQNAKTMRETADSWRDAAMNHVNTISGMGMMEIAEAHEEIDKIYNNMLSEVIAEENSKCMDRSH